MNKVKIGKIFGQVSIYKEENAQGKLNNLTILSKILRRLNAKIFHKKRTFSRSFYEIIVKNQKCPIVNISKKQSSAK